MCACLPGPPFSYFLFLLRAILGPVECFYLQISHLPALIVPIISVCVCVCVCDDDDELRVLCEVYPKEWRKGR